MIIIIEQIFICFYDSIESFIMKEIGQDRAQKYET